MKKLYTFIICAILALTMLTGVTACKTSGKTKLIVYTEAGFAPWEFTQTGSVDVIGVDMEIAKYIADKYDYKLEIINGNFDSIVAGIDEDNALGIAGISYNATRAKAVEYSDFYWGDAFQSVVYMTASAPTITDDGEFATSNFAGAKLVYQTGTTSSLTVAENGEAWGIDSTADFTQVLAALEDMKSATVTEYLIVDSQVAAQLAANDATLSWAAIEGVEAEQYGIVAKKGNTELIAKVNAALAELLVKDGDGKTQIDKWFEEYSAIAPDEEE
ncbi:MAG: transporter substrate-binding domain-containing protein [Clostridia bacterium]|nr:transporter substrate-binding domain-containing protein [Clostridia bacterium]